VRCGERDPLVLIGNTAADPDGPDHQSLIVGEGDATAHESNGLAYGALDAEQGPAGLNGCVEICGWLAEEDGGPSLGGAHFDRAEDGTIHAGHGNQVRAGVDDGDLKGRPISAALFLAASIARSACSIDTVVGDI
jgi:hypothetical protein